MKYEAVVFDMDGTILNTLEDLCDSVNFALRENNQKERTLEEVRFFVGNGLRRLVELAVEPGTDDEGINRILDDLKKFYAVHNADKTRAYDGIRDTILELRRRGCRTAVVSNKIDEGVQALCKKYFDGLFDVGIGEKPGVAKKPAPDTVNKALEILGVDRKNAVYVGDSDVDFMTAKNSEMDFIGVSWGFRGRKFLQDLGAEKIVDVPAEILDLV